MSETVGEIPTDEEIEAMTRIVTVLAKSRVEPFTTKSNFAREFATEIGIAASEGLITTRLNEGQFANTWLITAEGLQFMESMEDVFSL